MFRKFHFLCILLFSFIFCLTNTFADENGGPIDIEDIIAAGGFPFGDGEFQNVPEGIIGTNDFEKVRDLPTAGGYYQRSRKVGLLLIEDANGVTVRVYGVPGGSRSVHDSQPLSL